MGNVGFRQYTNFKRPDPSLFELLKGLPTPNLDDNMNRMNSINGLHPFNKTVLMGTAFTVREPAGDNLMFNRALDIAQPGDVIVVDARGGTERALCGEIMISHAIKRGLAGFIINGLIRDSASIEEMDFPVYALGSSPNGPYSNGPGEMNVPVVVGGMVVMPGDIIVGDADGLVVIHPEDVEEVAKKAWGKNSTERDLLVKISEGSWDRGFFADDLAAKGCEIIDD